MFGSVRQGLGFFLGGAGVLSLVVSSSGPSSEEGDSEKIRENPYYPIATATMQTRVFDVVHMFSERGISAVPIIDDNGVVVNLYETVDVIVSSSIEIFGAETNG